MQGAEVNALGAQLEALVALVNALSENDFHRATRCPGWTVAELVAHCEGMLNRLVGEHGEPAAGKPEIDRVGYYGYDPDGAREGEDPDKTFSEVVRDRVVREVDGRNGMTLQSSLSDAAKRAIDGVREIPADRVIKRPGHGRITFGEFVATRNLEIGVHTMDIAHAVDKREHVEPPTAEIIISILDGLLGDSLPDSLQWDATTYILTGTGRRDVTPHEREILGGLAAKFPLLR